MKRDAIGRLLLGLGTGLGFGFLLQKGRAAKQESIPGQLLLEDWGVVKMMGTATATGALGVHALQRLGVVEREIKPLKTGGVVLGGALFGAGMALFGYCPGTSVAAVGEGRTDALAGVGGMLLGALTFVRLYPRMKPLLERGDVGKKTLPELTKTPTWLWVAGANAAMAAGAAGIEALEAR